MIQDNKVFDAADDSHAGAKMPAIFIVHGNPMHAIEDSTFSHLWTTIGRALPRPRAILCISAHWESIGTRVTAMDRPRALHDFAGFPQALFDVEYPAPGSPALAGEVQSLANTPVTLDYDWGLDHGAWSVLCRLFPAADVRGIVTKDTHGGQFLTGDPGRGSRLGWLPRSPQRHAAGKLGRGWSYPGYPALFLINRGQDGNAGE